MSVKVIELKKEDDLKDPRVPCMALALTAHSKIDPASIDYLLPHTDEISVVITNNAAADSFDRWMRHLDEIASKTNKSISLVVLSPDTDPNLYMLDCPETFAAGRPFADEIYTGPFTGEWIPTDWSKIRNLALSTCKSPWRLSLQGGDVVVRPELLRSLCQELDLARRNVAYISTTRGSRTCHRALLHRDDPSICFEGAACETLEGGTRPAILDDGIQINSTKWISDRENFLTLYAESRRLNWEVPPTNLLYLASTTHEKRPLLASALLSAYLGSSLYPEERAWASALQGEICELTNDLEGAAKWYEASLAENPGWKSALRLCQVRLRQSRWKDCISAYERATDNLQAIHLWDDGPQSFAPSLIYLATSLHEIGKYAEARQACKALEDLFPSSQSVRMLCEKIERSGTNHGDHSCSADVPSNNST
jgi:tetratricopeptide (TPR) repeat protein